MPLAVGEAAPRTDAPHAATPRPATAPPASTDKPSSTGAVRAEGVAAETVQFTTASYTTRTRVAGEAPISLALNFPAPWWAGEPATLHLELRNLISKPVEQLEISLLSRAFREVLTESFAALPGREMLRLALKAVPAAAGQFLLTCTVKLKSGGQVKNYIGARVIWVNPLPAPEHYPLPPERVRVNRGANGSDLQAVWETTGRPPLSRLADWAAVQALALPEVYEPLELGLDYQLSVSALEESSQRQELYIPRLFITNAQTGTKLKLNPANPDEGMGIHLVARPVFKIGRSRMDSDYVTWFWPRSHANDERTRHLSRVHVIMEMREGRPMLRDAGSVAGSNYDGQPLSVEKWEPILRRATLVLAGEYYLEVHPAPGMTAGQMVIKNLQLWSGPHESSPSPWRGAIHFTPMNTAVAHHDAIWLFSEATFGTSRSNAIMLPESQGVSEVQGRFYYACGGFWLESVARNEMVRVNYYALKPGEVAPLINGQLVQLGRINYHVEILP
ncbi:MAG: hypothetical protein N3J91_13590 [Verrucomicrobiae bacterium]|nr:hypothetical protein [Verrucomicrobiae bacterium]